MAHLRNDIYAVPNSTPYSINNVLKNSKNTSAHTQNHDTTHHYEPIPLQPLPIQHQNQALFHDRGNILIQHRTTNSNPAQIRWNP
jgi:NAD-dependent SIR2 family protein deacetylase